MKIKYFSQDRTKYLFFLKRLKLCMLYINFFCVNENENKYSYSLTKHVRNTKYPN